MDQRAPSSGIGADGPQVVVEAMAGVTHGFCVDLSLSLFLFFGRAHKIVTRFVFLLDRLSSRDDTNQCRPVTRELAYFVR